MLIASRPTSAPLAFPAGLRLPALATTKHSRGAPAPEFCSRTPRLLASRKKEGGGAPKGASSHCPRRAIRCRHLNALRARCPHPTLPARGGERGGGSPHGAPRRRLPKRPNASAQPRPRFTRRRGRRRYRRRRSRLSGAPRTPVVVPEGRDDARAPGVRGSQANSDNLSLYINYMTDSLDGLLALGNI